MPVPVVITALGLVSAHGVGVAANERGFFSGARSLRPITVFDPSRQRVQRGGEVELPQDLPPTRLGPRDEARLDRASRLLLLAGVEAWQGSGLDARRVGRVPVMLGTSAAAMELGEAFYRDLDSERARRGEQRRRARNYQPAAQVVFLQRALGLRGPARVVANACASGANAIAMGAARIRRGEDELVLAGGYDALSELVFAGFDSLQALSTTGTRPFAADRDGLALGEGAAVLVLESLEHARARGVEPLAEVAGWGQATDLHHLTQPHPEGDTALATMRRACALASCAPEDIDYLNAHGTGTPKNDGAEAAAIVRWAGEHASALMVSSTKGQIGHTLGAAGVIEVGACMLALRHGFVPPNVEVGEVDPACGFDLVQAPRERQLRAVLSNSFGFGGANCSVVLKAVNSSGGGMS